MLTDQLSHLPDTKRRELERVVQVLFDEFEDAIKSKLSDKKKLGRILKVILFGSYARGDWVEDRLSGYRSDYDLLIVVNSHQFTDLHEYWAKADGHFIRELTVTQHIKTPVNFIVHSLEDVNDQLAKGRPFFSDIARDGIMLYEAPGHPLAKSKPLTDDEIKAEAQGYFEQWFIRAEQFLFTAQDQLDRDWRSMSAFNFHQATESLYHCALLVLTLYSPKSHRITMLRSQAEALDDRLKVIWPSETKLHRQAFDRLRRAYIEARYSAEYTVSIEELNWLNERIAVLRDTVKTICRERLAPQQPTI
ncbi:nucleotidyltransferase and HEPN domain-containing protein [Asticcacaulis sp. SL142]|uniref:nucleotidyltransferase and HEPN domain-containing protein n=1 Tax=Asticcacaulis sp. SL142 TaxID=2995155 RepID=UPI00226D31DB|nr:nucleotidyltransferase and HEPN domain-containing protein [Asticcacaulis sp. SL142]WAC48852.1 nucleotidyltransferase and HEPN domain-containing protein [Asticcacaulis sp. SL142]